LQGTVSRGQGRILQGLDSQVPLVPQPQQDCPEGHCVVVRQGLQAIGKQGFTVSRGQKSLQALEVQFPLVPQPQHICPSGHCVLVAQGSQAIGAQGFSSGQ